MRRLCIVLLAAVLLLTACAGEKPPADGGGRAVGVSMPTTERQRWNQDGGHMKTRLEKMGYHVELRYAQDNPQLQARQIGEMIDQGCEVLVVAAVDGAELVSVLDRARSMGIPVVAYDRLILNSDAVRYYATFDSYDVGVKQANTVVDALELNRAEAQYRIEFINGDPEDPNIRLLYDGAMSVLKPYLDSGVLVCPSGMTELEQITTDGWSTKKAKARFEKLLADFYTEQPLHAVLAANDSTASGVVQAMEGKNLAFCPVLTGQDCDLEAVQNILSGKQTMSVFKDTRILAEKTAEMVDALMRGVEPPVNDTKSYDGGSGPIPTYLCKSQVVTAKNAKKVLVDSGYYTGDQLDS